MKSIKKMLALVLACVLALSMAAVAFAEPVKGSITIHDSKTVSVAGKTFNAYKVLDAKLVDSTDASKGISYTVPKALVKFYEERYSLSSQAEYDFDAKVAEAIAKEEDMYAFASDVLAAAKKASIVPTSKTAGSEVSSVVIDNLAIGYYVVEDVGAKTPISALLLDTTKPNVEIDLKASMPAIDKKIDGDKDTDPSTRGEVEANNEAIGDKVPYIVKTAVPDMTGYKKYFFIVTDTLSAGLTFNNDVTITVGGHAINKVTDYKVTAQTQEDGTTIVKIVFLDFYQKYNQRAGEEIVINYSATLNDKAVLGEKGNPNKVNLEYSHNPNIIPEGKDEPTLGDKEKDVTGITPDMITKTFVTGIEIHKVNSDGKSIAGAEFELKGTRLNTVLVKTGEFSLNEDGTYYLLKDGTYTTQAPTDNEEDYQSTTNKYIRTVKAEKIEKLEDVVYKGTVGEDGVLRFDGLAAGEYTITELKAPDGYNLLKKPVEITIYCELPEEGTGDCVWTVTENAKIVDGIVNIDIVNKTGTLLPATGGIGTTIIYVVGGILVVGAAALLIIKKRKATNK